MRVRVEGTERSHRPRIVTIRAHPFLACLGHRSMANFGMSNPERKGRNINAVRCVRHHPFCELKTPARTLKVLQQMMTDNRLNP